MSLTYGLSTVSDLLAKLERDAKNLDDEVTSDQMFNFVVTGYSMIDWIKNDPNVPQTAKTSNEIQALYNDQWLKVCVEISPLLANTLPLLVDNQLLHLLPVHGDMV